MAENATQRLLEIVLRVRTQGTRQLNQLRSAVTNLNTSLTSTQGNLTEVNQASNNTSRVTTALAGSLNGVASSTTTANRSLTSLTSRTNTARGGLRDMSDSLEDLRNNFVRLALVGTAVIFPIKQAMEFETSMADVRKVVDGLEAPQALQEMRNQLLGLSRVIPESASGLATIAASGGRLGVAKKDIAEFTESVSKIALALDMTAEQAGDSMAKLANVMDIPIGEIQKFGDVVNTLADNTASKGPEILEVLNRVGATSKNFGMAKEEMAGLAAAMLSLGMAPERVATGLNYMLPKLQTATKLPEKAQAAFRGMGLSAVDLEKKIRDNATGGLTVFLEMLKKLPKEAQTAAAIDIFGTEHQAKILTLVGSLDKYKAALKLSTEETKTAGSIQREFEIRSSTTANQLKLFVNRINELAIRIGSVLLPAVNALLTGFTAILDGAVTLAQEFPVLTTAITVFGASLAAVRVASFVSGLMGVGSAAAIAAPAVGSLAGVTTSLGAAATATAVPAMTALASAMTTVGAMAVLGIGTLGGALAAASGPLLAVGAAVAAVSVALGVYDANLAGVARGLSEEATAHSKSAKAYQDKVIKLKELKAALIVAGEGSAQQTELQKELAQILPNATTQIDKQGNSIAKLGNGLDSNKSRLEAFIDAQERLESVATGAALKKSVSSLVAFRQGIVDSEAKTRSYQAVVKTLGLDGIITFKGISEETKKLNEEQVQQQAASKKAMENFIKLAGGIQQATVRVKVLIKSLRDSDKVLEANQLASVFTAVREQIAVAKTDIGSLSKAFKNTVRTSIESGSTLGAFIQTMKKDPLFTREQELQAKKYWGTIEGGAIAVKNKMVDITKQFQIFADQPLDFKNFEQLPKDLKRVEVAIAGVVKNLDFSKAMDLRAFTKTFEGLIPQITLAGGKVSKGLMAGFSGKTLTELTTFKTEFKKTFEDGLISQEAYNQVALTLTAALSAIEEKNKAVAKTAAEIATEYEATFNSTIQKSKNVAEDLGKAFESAFADSDFNTQAFTLAFDNIYEVAKSKGVDISTILTESLESVPASKLTALQGHASQAYGTILEDLKAKFGEVEGTAKAEATTTGQLMASLLERSMKNLNLSSKSKKELEEISKAAVKEFKAVSTNATATAQDVGRAFSDALGKMSNTEQLTQLKAALLELRNSNAISADAMTSAMDKVNAKLIEVKASAEEAAGSFSGRLTKAAKDMGVSTTAELNNTANAAKSSFAIIERGHYQGQVSANQVKKAFTDYAQKAIQANNGVVPSIIKIKAAQLGLKVTVDESGKAVIEEGKKSKQSHEGMQKDIDKTIKKEKELKKVRGGKSGGSAQAQSGPVSGAGSALGAHLAKYANQVDQLSRKAGMAYKAMRGMIPQSALNNTDELSNKLQVARSKLSALNEVASKHGEHTIAGWMARVARDAAKVTVQFYNQSIAAKKITKELSSADGASKGFISSALSSIKYMNLLDDATLDGLRSQLMAAKKQIEGMEKAAVGTVNSLKSELAGLKGNKKEQVDLQFEERKRALQDQIADAKSGAQEASLRQALSLLNTIHRRKLADLNKEGKEEGVKRNKAFWDNLKKIDKEKEKRIEANRQVAEDASRIGLGYGGLGMGKKSSMGLFGFADGGHIRGPGTGTSDSIPIRVSDGEYISDAKTTGFWGPQFFRMLKALAHTGKPQVSAVRVANPIGGKFAEGGTAMAAAGSNISTDTSVYNLNMDATNLLDESHVRDKIIPIIEAVNRRKR